MLNALHGRNPEVSPIERDDGADCSFGRFLHCPRPIFAYICPGHQSGKFRRAGIQITKRTVKSDEQTSSPPDVMRLWLASGKPSFSPNSRTVPSARETRIKPSPVPSQRTSVSASMADIEFSALLANQLHGCCWRRDHTIVKWCHRRLKRSVSKV